MADADPAAMPPSPHRSASVASGGAGGIAGARPRPRVGHVLHRMQYAGAEVLAADLLDRLRDRFDFVVLCLDGLGELGEKLAGEGQTVIDLGRRPGIDLRVARRLARAAAEHRLDLLHAHQYTPFFYAALSRRLGLGSRPPILFTEHGRHYPDPRKWKHLLVNRWLLHRRDRVTAVGAFVRDALVRNEAIPDDRIEVIHNGIDPGRFVPRDDASRLAARQRLDLHADTPVVMQVARFHPVKDHATAVRAAAALQRRGVEFVFVLIGDGELRRPSEALAAELGVAAQCRFVGVRDDVHALLPAADAFVLSSLSEGISVTLLEAMAVGVPIAATDAGGNREVVAHGETGLLSPRGNAEALAANLELLLRDPALREAMSVASVQRVHQRFTQAAMHARYAELYRAMCQERQPG